MLELKKTHIFMSIQVRFKFGSNLDTSGDAAFASWFKRFVKSSNDELTNQTQFLDNFMVLDFWFHKRASP